MIIISEWQILIWNTRTNRTFPKGPPHTCCKTRSANHKFGNNSVSLRQTVPCQSPSWIPIQGTEHFSHSTEWCSENRYKIENTNTGVRRTKSDKVRKKARRDEILKAKRSPYLNTHSSIRRPGGRYTIYHQMDFISLFCTSLYISANDCRQRRNNIEGQTTDLKGPTLSVARIHGSQCPPEPPASTIQQSVPILKPLWIFI